MTIRYGKTAFVSLAALLAIGLLPHSKIHAQTAGCSLQTLNGPYAYSDSGFYAASGGTAFFAGAGVIAGAAATAGALAAGAFEPRNTFAATSMSAETSCTTGMGMASPAPAAPVSMASTSDFLVAPETELPSADSVPTTNGMMFLKIERNLFTVFYRRERGH
jgi:hypothetical protein